MKRHEGGTTLAGEQGQRGPMAKAAILLAWRNLTENRVHLFTSVAGTAFAVTLMFMQNGFRNALFDSMTGVIQRLDGDLIMVSRRLYTLVAPQPFPARRLELVKGFDEVDRVSPLYVETRSAKWRSVSDGLLRRIRVIAARPEDGALNLPELKDDPDRWRAPETVMADSASKSKYGGFASATESELAGRRVRVAGTFTLGLDFQNDGTLVMSERNFLDYFPRRRGAVDGDTTVDVGVIRLAPGVDPIVAQTSIASVLPEDVRVLTRSGFAAQEQAFWDKVAPIGTVFSIGVVMGFIVGLAICYQVLFADIADRLSEFATLKAMGHGHRWLLGVVVTQAIFLSFLGYVAGAIVSQGLFLLVARITALPMGFQPGGTALILVLTVVMCVLSGVLAARRLSGADPAQLFR